MTSGSRDTPPAISDTPRTDALFAKIGEPSGEKSWESNVAYEMRQIERELRAEQDQSMMAGQQLSAMRLQLRDAEERAKTTRSEKTSTQWIPVGERLPSPHTDNDFIVATRSGHVTSMNFGEHGWYVMQGNDTDEATAKDGYWNGCITHWQELPEAPAENMATTL